jgi:hypothetical protein
LYLAPIEAVSSPPDGYREERYSRKREPCLLKCLLGCFKMRKFFRHDPSDSELAKQFTNLTNSKMLMKLFCHEFHELREIKKKIEIREI